MADVSDVCCSQADADSTEPANRVSDAKSSVDDSVLSS